MENLINNEIPAKDLFMMCSKLNASAFRELPQGFHFRLCRPDELEIWKEMSLDFPHTPEIYNEYMQMMTEYYDNVYAKNSDLFFGSVFLPVMRMTSRSDAFLFGKRTKKSIRSIGSWFLKNMKTGELAGPY